MQGSSFPPIFAIYRYDTKTFQLFESEHVLNGILYSIRPWNRPVRSYWRFCSDKKKTELVQWFQGEQWYVVPMKHSPMKQIHSVKIQNKMYTYWYLDHSLLWAKNEFDMTTHYPSEYNNYPSIPIIEFTMRSIFPYNSINIYPIWYSTIPELLHNEYKKGWAILYNTEQTGVSKPYLRIKTPEVETNQTDPKDTKDSKSSVNTSDQSQSISTCGILVYIATITSVSLIYIFAITSVLGL